MKAPSALILFLAALSVFSLTTHAQQRPPLEIESLSPENKLTYDLETGAATATNGVKITYGETVLIAQRARLDQKDGDCAAILKHFGVEFLPAEPGPFILPDDLRQERRR